MYEVISICPLCSAAVKIIFSSKIEKLAAARMPPPKVYLTVTIFIFAATNLKTTVGHKSNEEVKWPGGTYGLPKANSGCPKTEQFAWDQGWRLQNMDNDWSKYESSKLSIPIHMEVSLHKQFLSRTFCIKREQDVSPVKRRWPKGSYCIYQFGKKCPSGMVNGSIKWDDDNWNQGGNMNQALGSLPSGYYNHDTMIYYCCQNQSSWYDVIELPITSPFYLLPYKPRSQLSTGCQRVKWALATMEYIIFDTEDDHNLDFFRGYHVFTDHTEHRGRPKVHYCYYESCRYKMNEAGGIFNSSGDSFDAAYPSYQSCSWLITVDESSVVSLNLTSLYVSDCRENFLKIYDGVSERSPMIATNCGFTTPEDVKVLSSGRSIYMVLKSGNLSQPMNYTFGFEARYGPRKLVLTPRQTPHHVEAIGLTCSAVILIIVLVAVVIGYRKSSRNEVKEEEPRSRFHVPTNSSLETEGLPKVVPSSKETRNPYYVTARLWDDSSLSRSSENIAYVTSPELNHGYMDASGADHIF